MKKVLCLLCLLVFGIVLTACNNSNDNVLVVGMECDYAPFNWTETTKSDTNVAISNVPGAYAEGYDVQIAKKIADGLGMELEIKSFVWDGLIPALNNGEIDLIIAGMSPTEERKTSVLFTSPYYTSEEVCLVLADGNYANATSINDFNGAIAIGQAGTVYDELIPQLKGATHSTPLDSVPEIITAMSYGRCDVTIVEKPVALGLVAGNPSLKMIEFAEGNGFTVTEEQVAVSIALRLGEDELANQINSILSAITPSVREKMMVDAVSANE